MRPLLAAALALLLAPAAVAQPVKTSGDGQSKAKVSGGAPKVAVSSETAKVLAGLGWKALKDGSLARLDPADHSRVPVEILSNADFAWKDGAIVYDKAFTPVEPDKLGPILSGLEE